MVQLLLDKIKSFRDTCIKARSIQFTINLIAFSTSIYFICLYQKQHIKR
jgi:hypothetical protein